MARRKNVEINKRALELYTLDVLTTESERQKFNELDESAKEKKVNGYKQRNKALFVGVRLENLQNLKGTELNKLKQDLQNYLKEIDDAIKDFNEREIKEIENQIAELQKAHDNEIKKLNKKIEEIKNKKEETKKEETKNEETKTRNKKTNNTH